MTRAELVQECVDRGYDYVSTARIGSGIERHYQRICSRFPWPFLEDERNGTAPLAVTDLRRILSVNANEQSIRGVDRRWLAATRPDLSETGTAEYWYLEDTTLKTFPVDTATLTARIIKVPAVLGDSDEPLMPSEWQYLLVDSTVVDLLRDDDEYEEARALRSDVEQGVREMAAALLGRNQQNAELIIRSGQPGDYL